MKQRGPLSTIVLASSSPRRREIMGGVENRVETLTPRAQEGPSMPGETAAEYVSRLASEKAASARRQAPAGVVLAADTVVALGDRLFGKPETQAEARSMLSALRGRTHSVLTGISVWDPQTKRSVTDVNESAVEMRDYTAVEIDRYLATGAHEDKAGAYGVQDRSFSPVKAVEGCYLNVVGLPLCAVVELLKEVDARVSLRQPEQVPYFQSCVRCELDFRREA